MSVVDVSILIYRFLYLEDRDKKTAGGCVTASMLKESSRGRAIPSDYLIPFPSSRSSHRFVPPSIRTRISRAMPPRGKTRIHATTRSRFEISLCYRSPYSFRVSRLSIRLDWRDAAVPDEFSNARISTLFQNYPRSEGMNEGRVEVHPREIAGPAGRGPRRSRGFRRTG